MSAYLLRRILQMIPILLGVTIITFIIINAKGSPFQSIMFDPRIRPEDIARLEKSYGLDKPVVERYFIWLKALLQGDLGISLQNRQDVSTRILDVLPNTLRLAISSIILAFVIALPIGILAAVRRNSIFDRIVNVFSVASFAIPTVWLGLMLIILFAVKFREWGLPFLPVGGTEDLRNGGDFKDRIEHMILPVAALTIPQVGVWVSYIRSSMLEVLHQDYIRTAQAKGLTQRVVMLGHAFRNALLPIITIVGLSIPDIFGGALITESVFAYSGMGLLTINAIDDKDYPLVMGTTLIYAVLVLIGNLLSDILYTVADPRIRLE
jgi:peptide/nickel transport system permease protein